MDKQIALCFLALRRVYTIAISTEAILAARFWLGSLQVSGSRASALTGELTGLEFAASLVERRDCRASRWLCAPAVCM